MTKTHPRYAIGIDIGGTNIAAGIVDIDGHILIKQSIKTNAGRPCKEIAADIAGLCYALMNKSGTEIADIDYIGIGCPGVHDIDKGIVLKASNLGFQNAALCKCIGELINKKIYLDNDANAAALAEAYFGAAAGTDYSLMITLGTGIGCGVIINNKIYSGFNNSCPEAGHMNICYDGRLCTCGRKGCWEAYASATALINFATEATEKNPSSMLKEVYGYENDKKSGNSKFVFDCALAGDPTAIAVVGEYRKWLGIGLVNIVNMYAPEIITIGGGISNQGEYLLEPVREYVRDNRFAPKEVPDTRIEKSLLGNDSGIIGAALLGRQGII